MNDKLTIQTVNTDGSIVFALPVQAPQMKTLSADAISLKIDEINHKIITTTAELQTLQDELATYMSAQNQSVAVLQANPIQVKDIIP